MKAKLLAALAAGALTASAIGVRAANDKFTFPATFAEGVEYLSVDKPSKQVHVFYAPQAAIDAAKKGVPMPEGTVFTGVHYNAKVDADGNPVKGPDGRFVKDSLRQFAVMEKQKGWGEDRPADKRNGEWEYRIFAADHSPNDKVNTGVCFECHLPKASNDFVWSYDDLKKAAH